MTANVGRIDRIVRALIGVVLMAFGLGYIGTGVTTPWDWILGVVGIVLLTTSVFSICPAYALFGIRTCER